MRAITQKKKHKKGEGNRGACASASLKRNDGDGEGNGEKGGAGRFSRKWGLASLQDERESMPPEDGVTKEGGRSESTSKLKGNRGANF